MVRILALLITLIGFVSCKDKWTEEFYPDGVLMSKEPIWKTSVSVKTFPAHGVNIPPTVYEDGVVMASATGFELVKGSGMGRPGLLMLDVLTGRIRWKWDDYMYDRETLFLTDRYTFKDKMVFHIGPRTYCINLSSGKTEWKKWKADSVYALNPSTIGGIDERYFFSGRVIRADCVYYQPSKMFEDNLLKPLPEIELVNPQLPQEFFGITPIPRGATFFRPTVLDGDTMIVVAYQVPTPEAQFNIIKTAFGLYNLGKREWQYKDQILLQPQSGGVVDWCPVIYEEKIYWNANRDIVCNDLRTGREIWRKAFRQDFLFTPLIIAENKVIANNEDTWLYAMNVNTGAEIWKTKSAGTSTHLIYQDGYVYYVGGGDGLLHAVDVSNGKTMWKLTSPDLNVYSGAHFFGGISGVPAKDGKKGRIMANTGRHVYCYEAIK
jgi:outer membrane protein assembly factor BamB